MDDACANGECNHGRRSILRSAAGIAATLGVSGAFSAAGAQTAIPTFSALDRETRDRLSPDRIIALMKEGNDRFRNGKMIDYDVLALKRGSALSQYPAAAILGCIDSRAPAEIIFNARLGDTFNARVAGNVVNDDMVGSLEFACALAGAKVVMVLGHTGCGAVRGAISGAELGSLTGLLAKIRPAVAETDYSGNRSADNIDFVDAVAKTHVLRSVRAIRSASPVLSQLEKEGKLRIVGGMYRLSGGAVEFYDA